MCPERGTREVDGGLRTTGGADLSRREAVCCTHTEKGNEERRDDLTGSRVSTGTDWGREWGKWATLKDVSCLVVTCNRAPSEWTMTTHPHVKPVHFEFWGRDVGSSSQLLDDMLCRFLSLCSPSTSTGRRLSLVTLSTPGDLLLVTPRDVSTRVLNLQSLHSLLDVSSDSSVSSFSPDLGPSTTSLFLLKRVRTVSSTYLCLNRHLSWHTSVKTPGTVHDEFTHDHTSRLSSSSTSPLDRVRSDLPKRIYPSALEVINIFVYRSYALR